MGSLTPIMHPDYFIERLEALAIDQAKWSQDTFGTDADRGPTGPLMHLRKECEEAANDPQDIIEFADCLLLLMDATRRAGHTFNQLLDAAERKMIINKARQWPKPESKTDPVFHVKEAQWAAHWVVRWVDQIADEFAIFVVEAESGLAAIEIAKKQNEPTFGGSWSFDPLAPTADCVHFHSSGFKILIKPTKAG